MAPATAMAMRRAAAYPSVSSAFVLAALALCAGGMIYLFLRPEEAVFLRLLDHAGLMPALASARAELSPGRELLPEWFIYSLPDGLWAFAYALVITRLWSGSTSSVKYVWLLSIPVLGIGFELLQATGTVAGVFCMVDVAFCMAGIALGGVLGKTHRPTGGS